MTSAWFKKDLGDAMLAGEALVQLEACFQSTYPQGRSDKIAIFIRHESEGHLHCEVKAYFSPDALPDDDARPDAWDEQRLTPDEHVRPRPRRDRSQPVRDAAPPAERRRHLLFFYRHHQRPGPIQPGSHR